MDTFRYGVCPCCRCARLVSDESGLCARCLDFARQDPERATAVIVGSRWRDGLNDKAAEYEDAAVAAMESDLIGSHD